MSRSTATQKEFSFADRARTCATCGRDIDGADRPRRAPELGAGSLVCARCDRRREETELAHYNVQKTADLARSRVRYRAIRFTGRDGRGWSFVVTTENVEHTIKRVVRRYPGTTWSVSEERGERVSPNDETHKERGEP